jgi:hypothetical protein
MIRLIELPEKLWEPGKAPIINLAERAEHAKGEKRNYQ